MKTKKIFIDTNVFVGPLILSGIAKTRKTEEEKAEENKNLLDFKILM